MTKTKTESKWAKRRFATLRDLPGRKRPVRAVMAQSRTMAYLAHRDGETVTASGDDGAINLWWNDKGERCVGFCRWLSTKSQHVGVSASFVRKWLAEWWPKMGRE